MGQLLALALRLTVPELLWLELTVEVELPVPEMEMPLLPPGLRLCVREAEKEGLMEAEREREPELVWLTEVV